jgi:putative protein kinase ArgK-like GTPase of G3E family
LNPEIRRTRIAKTVVVLLKDNRHNALTVGIQGDWGAGKSSVLTCLRPNAGDASPTGLATYERAEWKVLAPTLL